MNRFFALWVALLSACGGETPELMLAQPDFASFESEVYPVLLRDCAFHACHGSSERFFQVYGPGRARLVPMRSPLEPAAMDEIMYTYNRALSMIDARDPASSMLLRKPLSLAEGGSGHQGVDAWQRDVYVTRQEPGFLALQSWVLGLDLLGGTPP
jgi:hypothetical protein